MIETGKDIATLLSVLGAGFGGGSVSVGSVCWYLAKRWLDKRDKEFDEMANDIKGKNRAEIDELKMDVAKIKEGCNAEKNAGKLEVIEGLVRESLGKTESVRNSCTRIEAKEDANKDFLNNINRSLQEHKSDHFMHGGH